MAVMICSRLGRGCARSSAVAANDHARGTEAAAKGGVLDEGLLHRRQASRLAKPLDGDDLLATGDLADRDHAAAIDLAVDQHRAGTAGPFATPELGPGEAKLIAQHPQQRLLRIGHDPVFVAVDIELQLQLHPCLPALHRQSIARVLPV